MDHAGAKSGTITGSEVTGGGYNGSVSGKTGGSGRSVGVGNGVKGYVEIADELELELGGPDGDTLAGVPDELGAVLEGAEEVKLAEVALEGMELVGPPEAEARSLHLSTASDPPIYPATDPWYPPPVSPDPQIVPDFGPAWATAHAKAQALIANFTIWDKVNLTTGIYGRCVGNIGAVGDFPGLCLEDSPLGVRYAADVTSFPAGITTASTWNRALMRTRGLYMGQEFKGKGAHIALGPMMNMGREAAFETILGMQAGGVQATAKHYINKCVISIDLGLHREWKRTQESSNVDDRTEHEIYAQPFMRAVMAGVSALMCSYTMERAHSHHVRLGGHDGDPECGCWPRCKCLASFSCLHVELLLFLQMDMPGGVYFGENATYSSYFGGNLTAFVMNDTISMARLDDMAIRIVASWYYLHQDEDYPPVSFNINDPYDLATNPYVNVQANHATVVRQIAAGGIVLLKNEGVLPLDKPKNIVLVGSDAAPPTSGPNEYVDQGGDPSGILAMGWGSGYSPGRFSTIRARLICLTQPYEAIQARARLDQTSVFWDFDDWNLDTAGNSVIDKEVAIVFVNSDSGEVGNTTWLIGASLTLVQGYITVDGNAGDRQNLTAWHEGDQLILAVAAQNNNTIVVTNSVGPLILEPWVEHPNVTAIVWASLGGNEAGNGIMDVLYGNWNPSGRLPYTIAKNATDYPAQPVFGGTATDILSINYTEGCVHQALLNSRQRPSSLNDITPRYEFGFGLSYTTFEYSDLQIQKVEPVDSAETWLIDNWENGGASPIAEGSTTALWSRSTYKTRDRFMVEKSPNFTCNASAMEPPSILKGFTNIELEPGQTGRASITLSRYDLSIWDVVRQGWARPNGTINFSLGASSRDFRLNGTIPE
ncbi:family 3 glycoside hydrolase [Lanmaoa asiatica]|nr:family 3 glycoside hydrolase [Lanmaoa asiatica]